MLIEILYRPILLAKGVGLVRTRLRVTARMLEWTQVNEATSFILRHSLCFLKGSLNGPVHPGTVTRVSLSSRMCIYVYAFLPCILDVVHICQADLPRATRLPDWHLTTFFAIDASLLPLDNPPRQSLKNWTSESSTAEGRGCEHVVFRVAGPQAPTGHRVTVTRISRAANPLRKETATFFGPQSDTGTLFTGN